MIEQAHQIDQLTQHPGWAVMSDWLNERMRPAKVRLLNGRIENHDEYLTVTGFLKGIHEVLDAPAKVAELVANERTRRSEKK